MPEPYYTDGVVTLYLGDMREVLPALGVQADCVVTDPPYQQTSITWDRWPKDWPAAVARVTNSMWCFGTMRMFLDQKDDFSEWKMSQDVVWQKTFGTGISADRFRRWHELVVHWYRDRWADVYHETPRVTSDRPLVKGSRTKGAQHVYGGGSNTVPWVDDGTRLMSSVMTHSSMFRRGTHPTEKPVPLLSPLIEYACPPGGLVLDPFAGSGSTLEAARSAGRRAIGVEADERYLEAAAKRLDSQG